MPAKTPLESKYSIDPTTGCWVWKKPGRNKYAAVRVNGKMTGAHVAVYQVYKGEVPKGLELDHLCRNPSCVNPEHLEPVTHKENTRRGLVPTINANVAKELRARYAGGETLKELSAAFGISVGHISEVVRGKYWNDSGEPLLPAYGSKRPKVAARKLSNLQVLAIRKRRANGESSAALAAEFSVHKCTIDRIVSGRSRFGLLNS